MQDPDTKRPDWKRDPYVIGFGLLLLLMLIVGVTLAVKVYLGPPPASASATSTVQQNDILKFAAEVHQATRAFAAKLRSELSGNEAAKPPTGPDARRRDSVGPPREPAGSRPKADAKADPRQDYPPAATPPLPHGRPVPANGAWAYKVFFAPAWTSRGQLAYQTRAQTRAAAGAESMPPEADMSWRPDGGPVNNWFFGTVAAHHPSHANTRFPGFFMHAAYLPESLTPGQTLTWDFPWQGGNASLASGERVRRFEFKVAGWEKVKVEAGEFDAARLDGTLRYVEKGSLKAEVQYSLWYAPAARQTVRMRWMGRAPDEGSGEMIAELASFRLP